MTKTFQALPRPIAGLILKRNPRMRLLTAAQEAGHLRRSNRLQRSHNPQKKLPHQATGRRRRAPYRLAEQAQGVKAWSINLRRRHQQTTMMMKPTMKSFECVVYACMQCALRVKQRVLHLHPATVSIEDGPNQIRQAAKLRFEPCRAT